MDTFRYKGDSATRRRFMGAKSFQHPAKMHCSLFLECLERYSKPGDTVLDCMAGSGTALLGAVYGRSMVLVELEEHFCIPMLASWRKIQQNGPALGCEMGQAVILRGDARCLPLPDANVGAVITSPPWEDKTALQSSQWLHSHEAELAERFRQDHAGEKGLPGNTKPEKRSTMERYTRPVDAIVTSPPYEGSLHEGQAGPGATTDSGAWHEGREVTRGAYTRPVDAIVTSPPYEGTESNPSNGIDWTKIVPDYPGRKLHDGRIAGFKKHATTSYGPNSQVARPQSYTRPVDAIVTSPPYERAVGTGEGPGAAGPGSGMWTGPGDYSSSTPGYTRPVDAIVTKEKLDTFDGMMYNNDKEFTSCLGKTQQQPPGIKSGIGNTLTKLESASESSKATTEAKSSILASTVECLVINGLRGVADVLIRLESAHISQQKLSNGLVSSSKNSTGAASEKLSPQIEVNPLPMQQEQTPISGKADMTVAEGLDSMLSRPASETWLESVVRFVEALNNWPSTISSASSGVAITPTETLFRFAEAATQDLKMNSRISDTQNTMLCSIIQGLRQMSGSSLGNIGNEKGPNYWASMFLTYQECWRVLKPGGLLCLVLKGFTRDGKYQDLPGQTEALLLEAGWQKHDHWRRELWSLSFWRILQKRRDPAAWDERLMYEDVLAFRKPGGEGNGVDAVLTSPPYETSIKDDPEHNSIDYTKNKRDSDTSHWASHMKGASGNPAMSYTRKERT